MDNEQFIVVTFGETEFVPYLPLTQINVTPLAAARWYPGRFVPGLRLHVCSS